MPLTLVPGEQVVFPSPYVPTEHNPLVITNRRVTQFSPAGPHPVSEFEVAQIDFIGRMSEKPYVAVAILVAALGLILLIAAGWKLLPAVLYAGHSADGSGIGTTADGRVIEGKDSNDDYPFFDKEIEEKSLKQRAEQLKKLSEIKPGLPSWNGQVKMGLIYLFFAAVFLLPAGGLYRREQFYIYCRTKDNNLHRIDVPGEMQQNMILACLQAAQQSAPR